MEDMSESETTHESTEEQEFDECGEQDDLIWFPSGDSIAIFKKGDLVGNGSYSEVYEVVNLENADELCIVKIYDVETDFTHALNEVEYLQKLKTSGFVPTYIDDYECGFNQKYYIVMSKVEMSLAEYIQDGLMMEEDLVQLKEIISTMHQTFKVRHNDIRLDNIGVNIRSGKTTIILLDLNRMTDLDQDELNGRDWEFYVLLKNNWDKGLRGVKLVHRIEDYGVK